MTDARVEVWSLSRMLSAPEGAVCLQTTAGFTQRKDMQQRGREKEIRPSPLNIYDLGPHRFLATFFAVFLGVGGWHWVTHTHSKAHRQAYMSVRRYVQIFTHAFTVSVGNENREKRNEKGE